MKKFHINRIFRQVRNILAPYYFPYIFEQIPLHMSHLTYSFLSNNMEELRKEKSTKIFCKKKRHLKGISFR